MEITVKHFRELTTRELYDILKLRAAVFVVEQNCPYQDLDGKDFEAYHVMLSDDYGLAAYLRVLDRGVRFPEAAISRVISVRRRNGIGTIALRAGISTAKEKFGADRIKVAAQCYAVPFYERSGFKVCSVEFLEDNIPHVEMLWEA